MRLDSKIWVEKQWPSSSFFDPRHHKRALTMASAMLRYPTTSIPDRFSLQKDIKGCYRFLNNKVIDHQMLQQQHYANILQEAGRFYEKDFTSNTLSKYLLSHPAI